MDNPSDPFYVNPHGRTLVHLAHRKHVVGEQQQQLLGRSAWVVISTLAAPGMLATSAFACATLALNSASHISNACGRPAWNRMLRCAAALLTSPLGRCPAPAPSPDRIPARARSPALPATAQRRGVRGRAGGSSGASCIGVLRRRRAGRTRQASTHPPVMSPSYDFLQRPAKEQQRLQFPQLLNL